METRKGYKIHVDTHDQTTWVERPYSRRRDRAAKVITGLVAATASTAFAVGIVQFRDASQSQQSIEVIKGDLAPAEPPEIPNLEDHPAIIASYEARQAQE